MSFKSSLKAFITGSHRVDQRKLWRSASVGSRALLLSAVFFLFASMGLLSDIAGLVRLPWTTLLAMTVFSGALATGYLVVILLRLRWLPVLILFQVLVSMWLNSRALNPSMGMSPAVEQALHTRLALNVAGTIACITVSYTLFIVFVTQSGKRLVQLDTELQLARGIHQSLVPRIAQRIGAFEFLGVSVPSGAVGGDLVDLVAHDDDGNSWTAYVADVSGHGVPSGVLMGMVKSAVRTSLASPPPLDSMLVTLNDVLYALSQPQMFATFAAIRSTGSGTLTYALAGHLPILCWRAATNRVEDLSVARLPLGMLPGRDFESAQTSYAKGDLFLVLTDGLTEVFDKKDDEFGLDGVRAVLAAHGAASLGQIEQALLAGARRHGTQLDDQSLILVRCV